MLESYPSEPKHLWKVFYDFTQTPRPSKNEELISKYIIELAKTNDLNFEVDQVGNIVIYVPGSKGRESEASLIIQNHIDMVTDALPGKKINFATDPLEVELVDGWVKAKGTTLGADNGIGCAAALAIIFEKEISHPPLELLFTVDEETGLHGALGLETKNLKSRRMLNLDTEEWGSFYIGCAGGVDYDLVRDYEIKAPSSSCFYELSIEGFIGGHSGLNIHDQRGNAIKVMTDILSEVDDVEIADLRFGKAHNIIPRDGKVIFASALELESIQEILERKKQSYLSFLPENDKSFSFIIEKSSSRDVISNDDSKSFLKLLELFPNGVHAIDQNTKVVSCSNNLAKALVVNGKAYILTSLRFFDREEVRELERKLKAISSLCSFELTKNSEYPSWKPVKENPLLDKVVESYKFLYNKEPEITAIHAGLECGILKDKMGEMDVCSFGPTIEGAHSPDERVEVKSVALFWDLLVETLKRI